jgi:endonuclease G, mitochondrial
VRLHLTGALAAWSLSTIWLGAPRATAQTITLEQRVARLEQEVADLRSRQGLAPTVEPPTGLPEELAGNANVRWGYPGGGCTLLIKEFYVICEDIPHREPEWVTYELTRATLPGSADRSDDFRPDPDLTPGERAELVDYRNSGYDRGHMAPAGDFKRTVAAMSATFLLSNMAPQHPNLNRGMWERLETQVRHLADAHGDIWVVTGPLYLDAAGNRAAPVDFIGPDRVAVPTHFFKVILCQHASGAHEMFAFLMPNRLEPLAGTPADYLVSVDRIEALSGLNFFQELPDPEEDRLEAQVATNWPIP